eukprot:1615812-Alexandrium_andersonii.AAC.1
MSASLVGSEMCIRDRKPWNALCNATTPGWIATVLCPSPENPKDEMAVSYTHLTLPTICSV